MRSCAPRIGGGVLRGHLGHLKRSHKQLTTPNSCSKIATNLYASSQSWHRSIATTATRHSISSNNKVNPSTPDNPPLSPRWLSDLKTRIGKCITFGLTQSQTITAGGLLSTLTKDWRRLVAGSEGYLTSPDRAGLVDQRVVWGEMDSMGHVNNVMYTRYAESARIEWAKQFALRVARGPGSEARRKEWMELWTPKGEGLILRSIKTEYKFPMEWPDRISVYHKLRNLPSGETDSFILDVVILSHKHQRPAARCIEDIVVYDYRARRKTNLRPYMADAFVETFELQEREKKTCLDEVRSLQSKVRELEVASWDRSDAKEDFGSASP